MTVMLAIETSQREGEVSLRDRNGVVHVETLQTAKRHDDDLLPAINRIMAGASLVPHDLEAVGVSIGPGGFTGLRVAVSTAMMLAEALGVKIAAVPSALVVAESSGLDCSHAISALACKGDTFWATYLVRSERGQWTIAENAGLVTATEFALDGIEAVLADEHFPLAARQRCSDLGIALIPPRFSAEACLRIATELLAAGQETDPLILSPIYPRQPEAVSIWEGRTGGVQ